MTRYGESLEGNRARRLARSLCAAGLTALLAIGVSARSAQAQDWWFGFTYGVAIPTGSTKEFTDQSPSWRNFGVEGRKALADHFALGFSVGWNVFTEETVETGSLIGVDISGRQFRYVNAFPILATAHYYIGQSVGAYRSGLRGFVGAGVGAYVIENRVDIGLFSRSVTNWHFGLAPEVGVAWKAAGPWALTLAARYNYALEASDVTRSYWTVSAGIVWSN